MPYYEEWDGVAGEYHRVWRDGHPVHHEDGGDTWTTYSGPPCDENGYPTVSDGITYKEKDGRWKPVPGSDDYDDINDV